MGYNFCCAIQGTQNITNGSNIIHINICQNMISKFHKLGISSSNLFYPNSRQLVQKIVIKNQHEEKKKYTQIYHYTLNSGVSFLRRYTRYTHQSKGDIRNKDMKMSSRNIIVQICLSHVPLQMNWYAHQKYKSLC